MVSVGHGGGETGGGAHGSGGKGGGGQGGDGHGGGRHVAGGDHVDYVVLDFIYLILQTEFL